MNIKIHEIQVETQPLELTYPLVYKVHMRHKERLDHWNTCLQYERQLTRPALEIGRDQGVQGAAEAASVGRVQVSVEPLRLKGTVLTIMTEQ